MSVYNATGYSNNMPFTNMGEFEAEQLLSQNALALGYAGQESLSSTGLSLNEELVHQLKMMNDLNGLYFANGAQCAQTLGMMLSQYATKGQLGEEEQIDDPETDPLVHGIETLYRSQSF